MAKNSAQIQPSSTLQLSGMSLSSAKDANGNPIYYLAGILQSGQGRYKVAVVWQEVD